jgi:hypothetical protein
MQVTLLPDVQPKRDIQIEPMFVIDAGYPYYRVLNLNALFTFQLTHPTYSFPMSSL